MKKYRLTDRKPDRGKRIKDILSGKSGITLVELIVTFALISLFAVSTSQIIANAIGVYHKIRGLDHATQVSDTLMDKISGEIEGATNYPLKDGETAAVRLSGNVEEGTTGSSMIELRDRTGSRICITATSQKSNIRDYVTTADNGNYSKTNQLLLYYYPVDAPGGGERYKAVDWTYDEAVYMGFHVKSLTFAQADQTQYPPNVIKVDLELTGDGYGNFHTTRYVRCYNFTDEDAGKIEDENGGTGGGEPEEPGGDNPPQQETYPGTDIVIQPNYWPSPDEWKGDPWEYRPVKAGGVFMYNGEYYIVTRDIKIVRHQAQSGPSSVASEGAYSGVFKLTGTIVEFKDEDEELKGLNPGDITLYDGEYYVYKNSGSGKGPSREPGNWNKIPQNGVSN